MTGFDELVTAAPTPKSVKLPDLVVFWRQEIGHALKESEAKPASKGLKAGLTRAARANLGVMKAMKWKPDGILEKMFSRKEKSRDAWTKSLAAQVGIKGAVDLLKWWQAAEARLLEESEDALKAAQYKQDAAITDAVEAFIGESFAACVIAQAPLDETWDKLVDA